MGPEHLVTPSAQPRFGFRRAQRLLLPAEYAAALRARPVAASPHFQVFQPRHERGARLGIIVGKRYVKRSVDRSALKRLIRELFRTRRPELPQADYLVRVRNPIREMNMAALRAELMGLFKLAPGVK